MKWMDVLGFSFKRKDGKNNLEQRLLKRRKKRVLLKIDKQINENQRKISQAAGDFKLQDKLAGMNKTLKTKKREILSKGIKTSPEALLRKFVDRPIAESLERDDWREARYIVREEYKPREVRKTKEEVLKKLRPEIELLIKMNYLNKYQDTRERQILSLRPWLDYFKNMYDITPKKERKNFLRFAVLMLRTVLKHDIYWMDKDEEGEWDTGERGSRNLELDFPIFDSDLTPEILAQLKGYVLNSIAIGGKARYGFYGLEDEEEFGKAYEQGDIRKTYFLLKEEIQLSRFNYEQVVKKEKESWQEVFTFKNCQTEEEKRVVANSLSKAVKNSRGFCLKSPSTAYDYLSSGDIYIYNVEYSVDLNKGKKNNLGEDLLPNLKKVTIPEIGVHVFRDKNGKESINPKELHGNAPNQGIRPEFLGVAKKWVSESNFNNKDEFETKFADAEMLEDVKKKVDNLEKGGPDLDSRELKFIYQIYRQSEGFELSNIAQFYVDITNLRNIRCGIIDTSERDFDLKLEEQEKKDFVKMFETENILSLGRTVNKPDLRNSGKEKIVVGSVSLTDLDLAYLSNTEEITGELHLRCNYGQEGFEERLKMLSKLKKVNGIEISDEDKRLLLKYGNNKFPSLRNGNDSRLKRIFY